VCVCVCERANERDNDTLVHARTHTRKRLRVSWFKNSCGRNVDKAATCGRVKCPPRETAARKRERVFAFPHRTQSSTINGDCHGGYCSRASDSPRDTSSVSRWTQSAGRTKCTRFEVASRKTREREKNLLNFHAYEK